MKLRTSPTLLGVGHSSTALVFSGSVWIPASLTTCPRYPTWRCSRWHLDGLSFSPAVRIRANTCASLSMCPWRVGEKTMTSSK